MARKVDPMIPSVGRIVHYKLQAYDVKDINQRRTNAIAARASDVPYVTPTGNPARTGDIYPMLIVRVFSNNPQEDTAVNGQVFLDGNDTCWVASRCQGDEEGQWRDPRETLA